MSSDVTVSDLVEIDGSQLEGGGQILRVALTLSAIRKVPIRIYKIRGGRSKPGLMEQHLKGVELLRDICNAKVKGASLGSTEIVFRPGEIEGGCFKAQVKTAGSISLLLQVALPCTLYAKTQTILTLQGGTNAEMAPQIDYTTEVFRPNLEKFGATFEFDLKRRGYYPRGGGEVVVTVNPVKTLKPVVATKHGRVTTVYGWSFVAGVLPISMAHRMANSAVGCLNKFSNVTIERYKEDKSIAPDSCAGIILVAETDTGCILGSGALGNRDEQSEDTGRRAAEQIATAVGEGGCFDQHCQDQIIILMALANGPSEVRVGAITMHTKTAIFVVEQLTQVTFEIIPEDSSNIIKCCGSEEKSSNSN